MKAAILCVDDDLAILGGFQRQFRNQFQIVSGLNGPHALETLTEKGPFAVVMSDFNMPGMNGLAFLRKVREISPDSVRIMLTGKADAEMGLAAVNDGTLFRFLTKPCSPDLLAASLCAALEQHHLLVAMRRSREEFIGTFSDLLTGIQDQACPSVAARAARVQAHVRKLTAYLGLPEPEKFDLAARLSHVGCITLSDEELGSVFRLDSETREFHPRLKQQAEDGSKWLQRIPGLAPVASMVGGQFEHKDIPSQQPHWDKMDPVVLGSQMLRLAVTLDSYLLSDFTYADAFAAMSSGSCPHHPELISALTAETRGDVVIQRRSSFLRSMKPGMKAPDDFITLDGHLLAAKGETLSVEMVATLREHSENYDLDLTVER